MSTQSINETLKVYDLGFITANEAQRRLIPMFSKSTPVGVAQTCINHLLGV